MKYLFFCLLLTNLNAQIIQTLKYDRFTHYEPDDWITYAPANTITSIDVGFENVYIGTLNGGILRYNIYDNEWLFPLTNGIGLRNNRINKVIFDHQLGNVYAQTPSGTDEYNPGFLFFRPVSEFTEPTRKTPDFPRDNQSFRFPPYSRPANSQIPNLIPPGNFEILLDGQVFDPANNQFEFTDRVVDIKYNLWLGTTGTGIAKADLDLLRVEFFYRSIPDILPRDILINRKEIWIAGISNNAKRDGIARWNRRNDSWDFFKKDVVFEIFESDVNTIEKYHDLILFGTEKGLLSYNYKNNKWKNLGKIGSIKYDPVYDILAAGDTVFIGTNNGLHYTDKQLKTADPINMKELINTVVYKIVRWKNGIFIATERGIYRYDMTEKELNFFSIKTASLDNNITAVGIANDTLWFAGQNTIGYMDLVKKNWRSFPEVSRELFSDIRHISFTEYYVWFATERGLLRYDPYRDYWYLYTTEDGLPSNNIYNIDPEGDFLWISTEAGVSKFRWYSENRFE